MNKLRLAVPVTFALLALGCGESDSPSKPDAGPADGEMDAGGDGDGRGDGDGGDGSDASAPGDGGADEPDAGGPDGGEPRPLGTLGQACETNADCLPQFTCGFEVSFDGVPAPNGYHSACTAACTGDAECDATAMESDTGCLADPGNPCIKSCFDNYDACPSGTFCNERSFCEVIERTGIDFDPNKGTLGSPCEQDADCNPQFTCGFDVDFAGVPEPNGFHSACVAPCTGDANCTADARESDTICLVDPGSPCVKGCGDHPEVCPEGTFCNEREFCERTDRR